MTNAQGGSQLAGEVMRAIATTYNWPDWRPTERTEVKADPAALARYVGTYELAPTFSITFTLEGGQLMTQATGQPKFPIYPESPTKFFLKVVDAEVEFFTGPTGKISHLVWKQQGKDTRGERRH